MGDEMNLEEMKVAELKQLAKELGITGYSGLKKADLIEKIGSHQAEAPPDVEEASAEKGTEPVIEEAAPLEGSPGEEPPAEEPVPEPVAEEPAAEELAAEEPVAEEPPAEEPAAEEPVSEEPPTEEPAVEEPPAGEKPVPEAPEEAAAEKPKKKTPEEKKPAPEPVILTPEMIAIKKEKRSLKGQIADAVSAGDREKIKSLRNRKKEIRRLLKRSTG